VGERWGKKPGEDEQQYLQNQDQSGARESISLSQCMCETVEERSIIADPKSIKYVSPEHDPPGLTIVEGRL
jgi:hypothetical protein